MAASLSDVMILCSVCAHPRHRDRVCHYREATAFRGYGDTPACRCGETGTTSELNRSRLNAAEKMTPRRRLVRRTKAGR
jgi:hypothetical protein